MRIFKALVMFMLIFCLFGYLININNENFRPLTLDYVLKVLSSVNYTPQAFFKMFENFESIGAVFNQISSQWWNIFNYVQAIFLILYTIGDFINNLVIDLFAYLVVIVHTIGRLIFYF